MLRPCWWNFGDPAVDALDRHTAGDALWSPGVTGRRRGLLPRGRWTHLLAGAGGADVGTMPCRFFSAFALCRPNTILPIGAVEDAPDYDFNGHDFRVYSSRLARGSPVPSDRARAGGHPVDANAALA